MDACGGGDSQDPAVSIPMVTVGYVLQRSKLEVKVVAELHADGNFRDQTAIPAGMVTKIVKVGDLVVPRFVSEWYEAVNEV